MIADKSFHIIVKTFKDCDWEGRYIVTIYNNSDGVTLLCSWYNEYGFHVWVNNDKEDYPLLTMKDAKCKIVKTIIEYEN